MPLFRQAEVAPEREREEDGEMGRERMKKKKSLQHGCEEEEEDEPLSLRRLCVLSLAENMKDVWTQDYAHNYMDHYFFRYVMGPFTLLPGYLIEELLCVLSHRKLLSRAALHLLLLPQLHTLSLSHSCNLVTANLCSLITVRCQSLKSLDLSGAQNVSSATLCSLLSDLSSLHSLSLAGTLSDRAVIATVAHRCSLLQHLDVSRCLQLPPGALLPLALRGPKRLSSVLALDIGLGEDEEDGLASAAFLLLGVSGLHRLAIDGLGLACVMIQNRDFSLTDRFTTREGVSCLQELWDARVKDHNEDVALEEKMDRSSSLHEGRSKDEPSRKFTLRLREVQGLTLDSLDAVSDLCPDLCSVSLNCHDDDDDDDDDHEGSSKSMRLTRGLARWSGQLHFLSLRFSGPLYELVPPLQVSGSCLRSLTLEGVQADGNLNLIALLRACPELTALTFHIDPPRSNQEEDDDEDEDIEDWDLPCLPHLRTLTLIFSLEEGQLKPVLCWTSLKGVLWSVLRGSLHLQTLSLIAAPCRLDPVFRLVLDRHAQPLRRLRHANLQRSTVTMETATRLVASCPRLSTLDVSGCWSLSRSNVTKLQSRVRRRRRKLHIVWT